MNSKFALIAGLTLLLTVFTQIGAKGGGKKKLKLVLDKLERVKYDERIISPELTFIRDGNSDEVVLNGIMETLLDLDNNYKVGLDIFHSTKQDGEKKLLLRMAEKGMCDILKNEYKKMAHKTIKNYCNAPDPNKCPMAKDKYVVNKCPLDCSQFSGYLRSGFYHIVATIRHKGQDVLQYRIEAHTE